jgi:indole-3-glycerol phosphate synthase
MTQTILDDILQSKRKEVQSLHERIALADLRAAAADAPRARNFFAAVTAKSKQPVNLIAEVKKASPSAGVIRQNCDPVDIASQYASAGASAVSVLTDEQYFQGSLDDLRSVRRAVELPLLRKDFIIDPWQVYQSRAAGADAILLIAAALKPAELMDLMILATELRMTSLVEVHDADEMLALRSVVGFPHRGYGLLGINNRNLQTFEVDINTTIRLTDLADPAVPIVSESGIKTHDDVKRLAKAGVAAILVGETLMRQKNIAEEIAMLLKQLQGG